MSEMLARPAERKLWYEGVNHTADAVVIDPATDKLLLILRPTGEWALPGGFVDPDDIDTEFAARREAREEAGQELGVAEAQVYKGAVDDPRNTPEAWIETSAYLFYGDSTIKPVAGDDADDADWFHPEELPSLYASHGNIVRLGIDYLESLRTFHSFDMISTMIPVDGGHMQYDKYLLNSGDALVFSKAHRDENFTDTKKAERSKLYLRKEADVMAHLRTNSFEAVPRYSVLLDTTLLMDAFSPDHDWRWRAPNDATLAHYVNDTLQAFEQLESMPLLSETFDIEPSYVSFRKEGWGALDAAAVEILKERAAAFAPRLNESSRQTAIELIEHLNELRAEGLRPHAPERYVASHHDARQSNIAWHPEHGTKVVDWSWFGVGEPGSDATNFLIDIHKSGHDIRDYLGALNEHHCLILIGFWLAHATWPVHTGDDSVRFQQFVSAVSAYEVLKMLRER